MTDQNNIQEIFALLNRAFSIREINQLAYLLFPSVYDQFSDGMTKGERIQIITNFADRQGQVQKLLVYIQENNEYQYNLFVDKVNFSPHLLTETPAPRIEIFAGREYAYIPRGLFKMGTKPRFLQSLKESHGNKSFDLETPQHEVNLEAYYISRYLVTNAEYQLFIRESGHPVPFRNDRWSDQFNWNTETGAYPQGRGNHPVVLVSWYDAKDYCDWLGGRLPTEAEWEKAARGIDEREWPWGNTWHPRHANTLESGLSTTTPVGQFSPRGDSPYSVTDLAGNVWEWCQSLRDPYPYNTGDGREDIFLWGNRVIRGGSWGLDKMMARCAYRGGTDPGDFGFSIGFRVVLNVLQTN